MKYKCLVNTHLKNHALKAGDVLTSAQIESGGAENLASLLKAGFIMEVGSESEAQAEPESQEESFDDSEEPSEEAHGKKKKGKK